MPQPIHTVSVITDTPQDISLISDTSISDSLNSQYSSPTPSQIASSPFNPPHGPISNIERLLSQAHWNHSFNIVNSSPSFQSSLPLNWQGTPPIITLSSNSPTPETDQHSHHCIGKHPDSTRTYPTLPLKFDPKFAVLLPPFAETIIMADNFIIGLNKESLNLSAKKFKLNLIDTQRTQHDILFSTIHTLDSLTHVHYKFNSFLA